MNYKFLLEDIKYDLHRLVTKSLARVFFYTNNPIDNTGFRECYEEAKKTTKFKIRKFGKDITEIFDAEPEMG